MSVAGASEDLHARVYKGMPYPRVFVFVFVASEGWNSLLWISEEAESEQAGGLAASLVCSEG